MQYKDLTRAETVPAGWTTRPFVGRPFTLEDLRRGARNAEIAMDRPPDPPVYPRFIADFFNELARGDRG